MPMSYSFYRFQKFPPAPAKRGKTVISLGDRELRGCPEQTEALLAGKKAFDRYEKYEVRHEWLRHTNGRLYEGDEFDEFYERKEFDAFVDRKAQLLICRAPRRVARDFVDVVNLRNPSIFNVDYMALDFSVVKSRLSDIRGIWFSNMDQPNLEAAAFFGPQVDKSDYYRTAQKDGTPSSYLVAYPYNDNVYLVILSAHYGISFLRDDSEALCFDIMHHMQEHLFKDAIQIKASKYNQQQRKKAEKQRATSTSSAQDPDDGHQMRLIE